MVTQICSTVFVTLFGLHFLCLGVEIEIDEILAMEREKLRETESIAFVM